MSISLLGLGLTYVLKHCFRGQIVLGFLIITQTRGLRSPTPFKEAKWQLRINYKKHKEKHIGI